MTETKTRGRPREFDTDRALDAVLETFRARGYGGTSLDDLVAATGLNRPSLYGAFGNKQALFEAGIDHYWGTAGRRYVAALRTTGRLRSDLRAFFRTVLDEIGNGSAGGCVVACSLPAEAEREPSLQAKMQTLLEQGDASIAARLAEAREAGELPADANVELLGGVVISMMMALSLRTRSGTPRAKLDALVEETIALVCGREKKRRPSPVARRPSKTAKRRR